MSLVTGLRLAELNALSLGSTGSRFYIVSANGQNFQIYEKDLFTTLDKFHISGAYQSKLEDWRFIHKTGTESITGSKTFINTILARGSISDDGAKNFIDFPNALMGSFVPGVGNTVQWSGRHLLGTWDADNLTIGGLPIDQGQNVVHITGTESISGNKLFLYADGTTAIDTNGALYDSAGGESVQWNFRTLRDNLGRVSLDWEGYTTYDVGGNPTILWNSRRLISENGSATTVDWANRALYDDAFSTSVDWQNKILSDTSNIPVLDWANKNLIGIWTENNQVIVTGNRIVYTTGNQNISGNKTFYNNVTIAGNSDQNITIEVERMTMQDLVNGGLVFEFNSDDEIIIRDVSNVNSARFGVRKLSDAMAIDSVSWDDRNLKNSSNAVTIDWQNQIISGNWVAQSLKIGNQSITTGNRTVNTTGTQTVSGSKTFINSIRAPAITGTNTPYGISLNDAQILDTAGNVRIDWNLNQMYDGVEYIPVIDWGVGQLNDTSQNTTVDWITNLALYSPTDGTKVLWGAALLTDNGGIESLDWSNRLLVDVFGQTCVNWRTYQLINPDLDTASLDWKYRTLSGTWISADQFSTNKLVISGLAPSTPTSAGVFGQVAISGSKLYIATGTNKWGFIPITSW